MSTRLIVLNCSIILSSTFSLAKYSDSSVSQLQGLELGNKPSTTSKTLSLAYIQVTSLQSFTLESRWQSRQVCSMNLASYSTPDCLVSWAYSFGTTATAPFYVCRYSLTNLLEFLVDSPILWTPLSLGAHSALTLVFNKSGLFLGLAGVSLSLFWKSLVTVLRGTLCLLGPFQLVLLLQVETDPFYVLTLSRFSSTFSRSLRQS